MKLLKLVPDHTNIHFLKWRVPFYVVSLLLIAASWTLVLTKGLNLGVDFVGGQMIRVTFVGQPDAPVAKMRGEIEKLGYGDPIIQRFGKPNEASIRMKLPEGSEKNPDLANTMATRITGALKTAHPGIRIDGVDSVSGKVSSELFRTGLLSLLFAMIAISIYIWVRFEWQFGVGALFALFHDCAQSSTSSIRASTSSSRATPTRPTCATSRRSIRPATSPSPARDMAARCSPTSR